MAEDKGKNADGSVDKNDEQKNSTDNSKRSNERVDYAKKMWAKIKESNASKDERGDLKEEVGGKESGKPVSDQIEKEEKKEVLSENDQEKPKKKRRRRRRKKKKVENSEIDGASLAEANVKGFQDDASEFSDNELPDSSPEKVQTTEGGQAVVDHLDTAATQPIQQVDASTMNLPPQSYLDERKADMEADDVGGQDSDMEGQGVSVPESEYSSPAVSPFAAQEVSKVSDSAFEERTLEKNSEVKEGTEAALDNQKDVEDVQQSAEVRNADEESNGDDFSPVVEDSSEAEVVEDAVIPEVIDSEAVTVESSEAVPGNVEADTPAVPTNAEIDEFKEDFWEILEQAGISKKGLLVFAIIIFLLIIGFVFFLFGFVGSDSEEIPVTEIVEEESNDSVKRPDDSSTKDNSTEEIDLGSVPYELVSSYIFGLEYNPEAASPIVADPIVKWADDSGIETAFLFGDSTDDLRIEFVQYMDLLRSMDNVFNTDVYALVNLSTNRREMLDKHISEMRSVIEQGEDAIEDLDGDLERMTAEFNAVALDRDAKETAFFDFSDRLYGQNAYENLEDFIELSQQTNEIKAQFEAKELLRDKLINALQVLIPRFEDIEANKEALLKGVRVFDVEGSDIDAIIPFTN